MHASTPLIITISNKSGVSLNIATDLYHHTEQYQSIRLAHIRVIMNRVAGLFLTLILCVGKSIIVNSININNKRVLADDAFYQNA